MGCPRLGLHISARAVRSMVPRFAAAFHLDSGQDRVRRALVQAGAGGKATHRGQ